jgi:hypothetical protein
VLAADVTISVPEPVIFRLAIFIVTPDVAQFNAIVLDAQSVNDGSVRETLAILKVVVPDVGPRNVVDVNPVFGDTVQPFNVTIPPPDSETPSSNVIPELTTKLPAEVIIAGPVTVALVAVH